MALSTIINVSSPAKIVSLANYGKVFGQTLPGGASPPPPQYEFIWLPSSGFADAESEFRLLDARGYGFVGVTQNWNPRIFPSATVISLEPAPQTPVYLANTFQPSLVPPEITPVYLASTFQIDIV